MNCSTYYIHFFKKIFHFLYFTFVQYIDKLKPLKAVQTNRKLSNICLKNMEKCASLGVLKKESQHVFYQFIL